MAKLPSRASLVAALKALRPRSGMDAQRVEAAGGTTPLRGLPAVSHEIERRGYATDSWPLAIVAVIECGVEHLVRDPQQKVALEFVLNIKGGGGSADARRELAMAYLHLSSRNRFDEVEKRGFDVLADRLLLAEHSPCTATSPPNPFGTFTSEDQHEAREWLEAAPRALLAYLGVSVSALDRSKLAAAILRRLPAGEQLVRDIGSGNDEPMERLQALLLRPGSRQYYLVLCDNFWLRLRRWRLLKWPIHYQPLFEDLMLDLLIEPGAGTVERVREVARVHAELRARFYPKDDPHVFLGENGEPTPFFFKLLNHSLDLLWEALLNAEADEWEGLSYLRDDMFEHWSKRDQA